MNRTINKFRVNSVSPSKSREGGANINCTEVAESTMFGVVEGTQFIIQTAGIPAIDEGTVVEQSVRLEEVDYNFTRDGEDVHVTYIKGVPTA